MYNSKISHFIISKSLRRTLFKFQRKCKGKQRVPVIAFGRATPSLRPALTYSLQHWADNRPVQTNEKVFVTINFGFVGATRTLLLLTISYSLPTKSMQCIVQHGESLCHSCYTHESSNLIIRYLGGVLPFQIYCFFSRPQNQASR